MSSEGLMVFTGNANPKLAEAVVKHLGIPLGKALVGRFSDGEVQVEIQENVRGKHVFILQSTCAPTNDNLMELMVMVDALKRASARRITAAIPYFGYARQDRRPRSARVAISAKVVANMLEVGFSLPVSGLRDWLRARPAPGTPARVARDAQARPETIEQNGWTVRYVSWSDDSVTDARVHRLDLDRLQDGNGPLSVRLVLDQ